MTTLFAAINTYPDVLYCAVAPSTIDVENTSAADFDGALTLVEGDRVLVQSGANAGVYLVHIGFFTTLTIDPHFSVWEGAAVKCIRSAGSRVFQQTAETGAATPVFRRIGDELVWFGPPTDGVSDDGAALSLVVQAAPAGSTVRLIASDVPYVIDHTQVFGKSGVTLEIPVGVTVNTLTEYGVENAPFIFSPGVADPAETGNAPSPGRGGALATIATLNGSVAKGAVTIEVTWSGAARIVEGDYFCINSDTLARVSFRAVSVVGTTITLDVPTWFPIGTGCSLWRYDATEKYHIIIDGKINASFDGVMTGSRVIELNTVWNCSVSGHGTVEQIGGTGVCALIGYDVGGCYNVTDSVRVIGIDPTTGTHYGYAFEGQRKSRLINGRASNLEHGLWTSSCAFGEFEILAENCQGVLVATENVTTPSSEFGCHYNEYRLRQNKVVPGGYAVWLSGDTSDNNFEIDIDGGSVAQVNSVGIYWGANGTLGANNNHVGTYRLKNMLSAQIHGTPSVGNTIDEMRVENVQSLCAMNTAGCQMRIRNLRGAVVSASGGQLSVAATSELTIDRGELTITRTTGTIFYTGQGHLVLRNFDVTHAGSGYEYGFHNVSTSGSVVELENCALGAWATNFEFMLHGDSIILRGKVSYSGSTRYAHFSRALVTLTGTTTIYVPAPTLVATTDVRLVRKTAGGSSHTPPTWVGLINTSTRVGLGGYSVGGGGTWASPVLTEDTGNTPHYVEWPTNATYVRGPQILKVNLKAVGRTWAKILLGTAYACINLATGAQGASTGVGTVIYGAVLGDASVNITLYMSDVASQDLQFNLCNGDNVDVYVGNGSTLTVANLVIAGINAVAVTAEANNADVYVLNVA